MSEENKRIQEWLEKFHRLVDESYAKLRLIKVRRQEEEREERWISKRSRFDTQRFRKLLVRGLLELYHLAETNARNRVLDMGERIKWTRVAAYIAQTINTIMDTYDAVKIEQVLDELKQYVKIQLEEGR